MDDNVRNPKKRTEAKEEVKTLLEVVQYTKKEIRIAVNGGYINVLELKLSGKRTMDSQNLLNGYTFSKDSKVL